MTREKQLQAQLDTDHILCVSGAFSMSRGVAPVARDVETQNLCHTPGCYNPVAVCRCAVCRIYWCSIECMSNNWRFHAEEECYPYGLQLCKADECERPATLLCKKCRSVCYCSASCQRFDRNRHQSGCVHRTHVSIDDHVQYWWHGMHTSPGAPYSGLPTVDDVREQEEVWGRDGTRASKMANWLAATDPCKCLGGHVCSKRRKRFPVPRDPSCVTCVHCICGYGHAHCVHGCPVRRLVRFGVPFLYAREAVLEGHGLAEDPKVPDMCKCEDAEMDEDMGEHMAAGCPNVYSFPSRVPSNGHGPATVIE